MPVDTQQLQTLLDLLGVETLTKVRDSYIQDSQTKMVELRAAVEQQDLESVSQLSHSLKSASGNLSLNRLAELFAQMESQSNQGEASQLNELYQLADTEYQHSIEVLNNYF